VIGKTASMTYGSAARLAIGTLRASAATSATAPNRLAARTGGVVDRHGRYLAVPRCGSCGGLVCGDRFAPEFLPLFREHLRFDHVASA
jgi:hypothetical protein